MTTPPPSCWAVPPHATERCGAPAVATIVAACDNGHQGAAQPVCARCLTLLMVVSLMCFQCHEDGAHRVPINMLMGELEQ